MFELEGSPREGLNMIERNSAYGMSVCPHKNGKEDHFQVSLVSLKDRVLHLFYDTQDNSAHIEGKIDNKDGMRLQRVFVQSTTSWGVPVVQYVELFGYNPSSGEPVYEKKVLKK